LNLNRDTILATVVAQIRQVVPELENEPIAPTDAMADLGLDSVSRQEVLIMTMEEIGLNLPMVQLFGPRNIGELTDLLHAKLHA
jgi:polyketide biosynthesis acyl carrier protein